MSGQVQQCNRHLLAVDLNRDPNGTGFLLPGGLGRFFRYGFGGRFGGLFRFPGRFNLLFLHSSTATSVH